MGFETKSMFDDRLLSSAVSASTCITVAVFPARAAISRTAPRQGRPSRPVGR